MQEFEQLITDMKANNAITAVVTVSLKEKLEETFSATVRLKRFDLSIPDNKRSDNDFFYYFDSVDEMVLAMDEANADFGFVIRSIDSYEVGLVKCTDIDWDTDDDYDEDETPDLPMSVVIFPNYLKDNYGITDEDFNDGDALGNAIVDCLSDSYGFCVNSYSWCFIPQSEFSPNTEESVTEKYVMDINTFINKSKKPKVAVIK